jgi:serine/threonine-protein kinase RsbW
MAPGSLALVDQTELRPSLDLDLPAAPESCPQARHAVRELLAATELDAARVDLAVSEAVANAVLHAYRERDADDEPGRIRVIVVVDADAVHVHVADDGSGLRPRPDNPGLGLGLALIANACDELTIDERDGGTHVRMRFALGGGSRGPDV